MAPGRLFVRPVLRRRLFAPVTVALLTIGASTALTSTGAHAAGGFSPGDVVVYRVGDGSAALGGNAAPVFLDEYAPSGVLVQSVALPTAASGANKILTASGTATSEGGLTLSADRRFLVATGYSQAPSATVNPSSATSASITRTVASVSATDVIDSSTSLTNEASANNIRGAASTDGSRFWVSGADSTSGVLYAVDGASAGTAIVANTYKNGRQAVIANNQLYLSADPTKASVTVATVGTGLPTSGTNAVTNLPFSSAPNSPYGYSFLTLGTGSAPDTLYVADNGAGAVVKYVLSGGTWTKKGSVAITGVLGVTANDNNGVVTVYASAPGGLYSITDSSGLNGSFTAPANAFASAGTNQAFRGVAFAPGTVLGSGGGNNPAPVVPVITPAYDGLPAALGDPTNPSLPITLSDANFPASSLQLTATSSNTGVAAQNGLSLSGTGATRTLTVTPLAVGYSTITVTAQAPDGSTSSATIKYGVSANQGDAGDRYFDGAGNLSTAIDVGGGYMLVGDDNDNIIRLDNETQSGEPVKTFDFTAQLPYGTTSVDTEGSTRIGNTIYWTGSMTNTSSGNLAPSRSTVFAATVSGSGATTTLTYAGAYTGLKADFATWDHTNGHGLGADHFGLTDSQASGVGSHDANAFDVEGLEAIQGGGGGAYFALRAPDQPTSNRHLALVVPVTNLTALIGGSTHATFGTPLQWDLGGLGVREIRKNANGTYLIIAGTSTADNSSFVLYSWDGDPRHPPLSTGLSLPLIPAGANQGSWETIVNVPDGLTSGTQVQLVQDDGNTAWYGDTATSKDTLLPALQKDLGRTFAYTAPTPAGTTTAISSSTSDAGIGDQVTYTATVSPSVAGTPTGTVTFSDGTTVITDCSGVALDASRSATCSVSYPHASTHNVTATYNGDTTYATSTSTAVTVSVHPSTLTITADDGSKTFGSADPTFTYTVGGLRGSDQLTTAPRCAPADPHEAVGSYPITCSGADAGSDYTIVYRSGTLTVGKATPSVTVVAGTNPVLTGQPFTLSVTVAASAGAAVPTGTVEFTAGGVDLDGCAARPLDSSGKATCDVTAGLAAGTYAIVADYSGDGSFATTASDGALNEQVTQASTTTAVAASPASPAQYGSVTFIATVGVSAPGADRPTGTVSFSHAGTVIPGCDSVTVASDGTAACATTVGQSLGAYTVDATYGGSPDFVGSTGSGSATVVRGTPTNLTVSPTSASVASGVQQAFMTRATDSQGRDLGDVTQVTSFAISPDGTCSANTCAAAAAGSHTVTASYGGNTAVATLTVTAGATLEAPLDYVGVGDELSQHAVDFFADGAPGISGAVNGLSRNRIDNVSATADGDDRALYGPAGGTAGPVQPSVVLDPGTRPVPRPNGSTDGIAALLADTGSPAQIQFVRSSRLPTPSEQSQAAGNGWGGLHVVQYASGTVQIAVAASGTDAPAGLSTGELLKIYDGSWTTWSDVPGYAGPAASARINALLPAAGSDTRAAFDADLTAANGGHPVHYAASLRTVPADDYTEIAQQDSPPDTVYPVSGSLAKLQSDGYFGRTLITALTGTSPDGQAAYDGAHACYVVLRDSDVERTEPVVGSTLNWAHLLFVGRYNLIARASNQTRLAAAGLTPSYADLGDASSAT